MTRKIRFGIFIIKHANFRLPTDQEIQPSHVILVDGDLILNNENIRKLLNIKIFVDTDEDVRLSRRVLKYLDVYQEFLKLDEFLDIYFKFVKPAYEKYVEPTKKYADIIMPNYGFSFEGAKCGSNFLTSQK